MPIIPYAADERHPVITASVPFFFYNDLEAAADWYENKLGLKLVTDEDWVKIIKLTPSAFLGLTNAPGDPSHPTENKGAVLSIETAELEAWWEKLNGVDGIDMINGIEEAAGGMIQQFRMNDPEGYIVEFFRWRQDRPDAE